MSAGRHTPLYICFQNTYFTKSISEKVIYIIHVHVSSRKTLVIKFIHKFSSTQTC